MNNKNQQSKEQSYQRIIQKNKEIDRKNENANVGFDKMISGMEHRIKVCRDTPNIITEADKKFNDLTSILTRKDLSFLVFSLMFQGAAKYYIKLMRDMTDKELADINPLHFPEHSLRNNHYYYASIKEILSNPVPFDALKKNHPSSWFKENDVENPGFSGANHRAYALGHDPLLGLIFGTANIMTSTITRYDFQSWHVKTVEHQQINRAGTISNMMFDTICQRASTIKILTSIEERIKEEGEEGWYALCVSLWKEIVHLSTDIASIQSLPLPVISTFSPKLSRKLSLYGLNTGTIVEGSLATKVINWLIAVLHRLSMNQNENEELYKVRTQKILMISNTLATTSDLAYTLFSAYRGDRNALRKFDLGGYLVTLDAITTSESVITAVNTEFRVSNIIEKLNNH